MSSEDTEQHSVKIEAMQVLIVTQPSFPPEKKYLAQWSDYPVRNGSGPTVDDAIEDLLIAILAHLHDRRVGRRN